MIHKKVFFRFGFNFNDFLFVFFVLFLFVLCLNARLCVADVLEVSNKEFFGTDFVTIDISKTAMRHQWEVHAVPSNSACEVGQGKYTYRIDRYGTWYPTPPVEYKKIAVYNLDGRDGMIMEFTPGELYLRCKGLSGGQPYVTFKSSDGLVLYTHTAFVEDAAKSVVSRITYQPYIKVQVKSGETKEVSMGLGTDSLGEGMLRLTSSSRKYQGTTYVLVDNAVASIAVNGYGWDGWRLKVDKQSKVIVKGKNAGTVSAAANLTLSLP